MNRHDWTKTHSRIWMILLAATLIRTVQLGYSYTVADVITGGTRVGALLVWGAYLLGIAGLIFGFHRRREAFAAATFGSAFVALIDVVTAFIYTMPWVVYALSDCNPCPCAASQAVGMVTWNSAVFLLWNGVALSLLGRDIMPMIRASRSR